jgi:hypoxanthine-DNA glycosylase
MLLAVSDVPNVKATEGFSPILGQDAAVLILGTLPSRKSLEQNQYYGHPQNVFWPIMGELFGTGEDRSYATRTKTLTDNGIAVWDVLASSVRPGSMDSAIDSSTAVANDFAALFREQPKISLVCFNGQAAAKLYARFVAPTFEKGSNTADYQALPSTSPAHASMSFDEKLDRWQIVRAAASNRRKK